MAGITNLAKGAAKNIAQALSTDGVGKALAKRAAAGAGIGAVGGGTLSAIQGGSFGEGAVRGGFVGAGIGAASGAYKMGAFGNSVLDEAGRFRKGATSVYSHVATGNATWEQVNKYRQKDFKAFMGHMRDAQDAEDLAARFRSMDTSSKNIKEAYKDLNNNFGGYLPETKHLEGSSFGGYLPNDNRKVPSQIGTNPSNNGPVKEKIPIDSQMNTNPSTQSVSNITNTTGNAIPSKPKINSSNTSVSNIVPEVEPFKPYSGDNIEAIRKELSINTGPNYIEFGNSINNSNGFTSDSIRNLSHKYNQQVSKVVDSKYYQNKIQQLGKDRTAEDIINMIKNDPKLKNSYEKLGYNFENMSWDRLNNSKLFNKYINKENRRIAKEAAKQTQVSSLF